MTHDSLARFDRVRALRFDAQGLALLDQRALPSSSLWLPMASADDVIAMPLQCSTQWDGLGHIFDHGRAWNGRPAQEMYEGTVVVAGLPAFAGVHFNSDDGPKCATCHLPEVAVESGVRSSHTFKPVVTFGVEGLTDSCAACHERQAQPSAIGLLIADIQEATQLRLDTARSLVNSTSPAWITEALDFVEHDGSLGIHNYTYSDALLDAVYDALGLYGDTEAAAAAAGAGQ